MKAKRSANAAVIAVFIAAQTAIYITFMGFDLPLAAENAVKYSSVILCAAFTLYSCRERRACNLLLFAALVFTAVSDWFLLVAYSHYEFGLSTFIIAQFLHFTRIYAIKRKFPKVSLLARILISAAAVGLLAWLGYITALTALAAVYFVNLVVNFADSLALIKVKKLYAVLSVGFILFICCDVCVGIYNLGYALSIDIPKEIVNFADKGMWAFYLPSQTLIALSGEIK